MSNKDVQVGRCNQLSVDYFVSKVENLVSLQYMDGVYSRDCLPYVLEDIIDNCISDLGVRYLLQISFYNLWLVEELYSSEVADNNMTPIELIRANLKEDIKSQVLEGTVYNRIK